MDTAGQNVPVQALVTEALEAMVPHTILLMKKNANHGHPNLTSTKVRRVMKDLVAALESII